MRSRLLLPPCLWVICHLLSRYCLATISGFEGTSDGGVDSAPALDSLYAFKQDNEDSITVKVRELLSKLPNTDDPTTKAWLQIGLLLLDDKAHGSLGFDMEGSSKAGADSTVLSSDMSTVVEPSSADDVTISRSAIDGGDEQSHQTQRDAATSAPMSTLNEDTDPLHIDNASLSTANSSGHSGSHEQGCCCGEDSSGENSGSHERGSCCDKGSPGGHDGYSGSSKSSGYGGPPGQGGHSGKDECCGKGDSCGMSAYFEDSYKSVILFSFWKTLVPMQYYASLILIFLLSLLTVCMKVVRRRLTNAFLKPSSACSYVWKHMVLGAIAFIVTFMDFCMMLIVMTFNVGIVLVVCAGYAIGYVLTCYTFVLIDDTRDEESPIECEVDCC